MPGAEASGRMQRLGPQHVAAASWVGPAPGTSRSLRARHEWLVRLRRIVSVAPPAQSPGASPTYAPGPIVLPVTPRQARRAQPSQSPRPAGSGGTPGRGGKRGNATATDGERPSASRPCQLSCKVPKPLVPSPRSPRARGAHARPWSPGGGGAAPGAVAGPD